MHVITCGVDTRRLLAVIASNLCFVESPSGWAHRRNVSSAADCLLLRLPSIRARSLGLRSIGEGTRRLTGDGPSTEAAEEATGGKGSSNDKCIL